MRTGKIILLVFLLSWLYQMSGIAQTRVQVITKTIERNLEYREGDEVNIRGEKATIKVIGWDKDYIGLTLKLIAKHPDKAIAEEELKHLKHIIDKRGRTYELVNYFSITKDTNPIRANLKAEYEIHVPFKCPISITAKYGDVSIRNTRGHNSINLEFSKLTMTDVAGEMEIQTVLGDIVGVNTNMTLKCKAEKSDINLNNAAGEYHIENTYGHITIVAASQMKKLKVEANRTDVTVITKQFDRFSYDLTTVNSEIYLTADNQKKVKAGFGGKKSYQSNLEKSRPMIQLSTTNSPITILK